jgi:integrase
MVKKTIEEGEEILEHCKNEMDKLGEKVKNDIQLLNTWDITVQMYCVLKIYLDIGNLRGDEVVDMKILDTDTEDKINYINTTTKKIIIKNHKTEKSQGTRIIDIEDKKLMGILRKGLGKYLITDTNGELFKTSSKFGEYFKSMIGYNPYDLRKSLTSKCIRECLRDKNTEQLEQLAHTQGHSLSTMLNNYNTYNQENIILDTCLID